jgi:hypothetical protein
VKAEEPAESTDIKIWTVNEDCPHYLWFNETRNYHECKIYSSKENGINCYYCPENPENRVKTKAKTKESKSKAKGSEEEFTGCGYAFNPKVKDGEKGCYLDGARFYACEDCGMQDKPEVREKVAG